MKRMTKIAMLAVLLCTTALWAQRPRNTASAEQAPQVSMGYLYQSSDVALGDSRFGLNGGRADMLVPISAHFGVVGEFSGVRTGSVPGVGTGLTLLTYMAGPRFSLPLRRGRESGRFVPFAQTLFGGVHASDGQFPSGSTMKSSSNSFAMSAGGGFEVGLGGRVSLRLIQAEYLYTRLPNLFDGYQNSYRVGTGIVLRLR